MLLSRLLTSVTTESTTGPLDREVNGLSYDSRQVSSGDVFFALPGLQVDGRRFVPQAIAHGAQTVVSEAPVELPEEVTGIRVPNARLAMAEMARVFYHDPAAGMLTIGVTGTNGKTTVCTLLEQLLKRMGRKPAVFGTVNYRFGSRVLPAAHTTPEAIDLLRLLAEFRQFGADTLIMEVSSHALEQFRAEGIRFDQAIFTNLTPEHLDYHGTMEAYFQSKERLFTELLRETGVAVLNVDDPYGRKLADRLPKVVTVSQKGVADVVAETVVQSADGMRGCLKTPRGSSLGFSAPLVGAFNLSNLLCSFAAALEVGADPQDLVVGLEQLKSAPGRMQRVDNDFGALILVDYAHTGDALEKALHAVQGVGRGRTICLFGCGGDRDAGKRPVMGQIAGELSDIVILTSDNPRTEDPLVILEQIRAGVQRHLPPCQVEATGKGYVVEPDRRLAIEQAVQLLEPGDLLLVAGKGHEDYQILGTERIHFDDAEEIQRALKKRKVTS